MRVADSLITGHRRNLNHIPGVEFLEERTVGPSLGNDSIRDGMYSGVAGVIAVVLIMLIYYKKAGINAFMRPRA